MEQTYSPEAVEFAVSAIENAAAKAGVTGDVVYKALSAEDGIRNFLLPSYDALHTQSIEYIADEVLEYLKAKNARV
ncbi:MAG: DUF3791 domain-containing protein [Succinivibrionaceae bacterium]|jgi:hypothetical protein|nr:DUF3791 domain-containing protein [Succinivibrionaceae bacterium]MDY6336548.1 DUF3791 domain-containing protein [Succinivibrionaceae bacterium]